MLQGREKTDKVGEYQATLLRALLFGSSGFGLFGGAGDRGMTERSPSVGSRLTGLEFSGGPNLNPSYCS
jgi:hypothetical protein